MLCPSSVLGGDLDQRGKADLLLPTGYGVGERS